MQTPALSFVPVSRDSRPWSVATFRAMMKQAHDARAFGKRGASWIAFLDSVPDSILAEQLRFRDGPSVAQIMFERMQTTQLEQARHKAHKPGGEATGAKLKAKRQANVDYVAAFVAWMNAGLDESDLQGNRRDRKFDIQHVMRGADLAEFRGLYLDKIRELRSRKPAKSKVRSPGWKDPRKRDPDAAMPSHKQHNDWLRELREMGYPAAPPTDEKGSLATFHPHTDERA